MKPYFAWVSSCVETQGGIACLSPSDYERFVLRHTRAIIDAMAGTMGVTSRPGRGSRFWFTVPLAASAERISTTRH